MSAGKAASFVLIRQHLSGPRGLDLKDVFHRYALDHRLSQSLQEDAHSAGLSRIQRADTSSALVESSHRLGLRVEQRGGIKRLVKELQDRLNTASSDFQVRQLKLLFHMCMINISTIYMQFDSMWIQPTQFKIIVYWIWTEQAHDAHLYKAASSNGLVLYGTLMSHLNCKVYIF